MKLRTNANQVIHKMLQSNYPSEDRPVFKLLFFLKYQDLSTMIFELSANKDDVTSTPL